MQADGDEAGSDAIAGMDLQGGEWNGMAAQRAVGRAGTRLWRFGPYAQAARCFADAYLRRLAEAYAV